MRRRLGGYGGVKAPVNNETEFGYLVVRIDDVFAFLWQHSNSLTDCLGKCEIQRLTIRLLNGNAKLVAA
jgi:hypothetical protein